MTKYVTIYKMIFYAHGGEKMGEYYTELLVKRKSGVKEKLMKVLLVAMIILSLPTVLMYRFGLLIVIAVIAFAVFMFTRMDVEFEYLYFNGDLDVDIIYHKMKRKKIFSMNISELEMLAPIGSMEVKHYDRLKTFDYSSGTKSGKEYVMIVSKNGQKGRIIFEPNEKMVEDLFYKAPRKVIRK